MKMKRLITKSTSLLLAWALESRPERTRTLARIVKTVTRLQIWANCWKWFTYIVRHASSGKKNTFLPFLCCCTADAQIGAGIHQLYNNVSLVHFLTACRHTIVVHLRQKNLLLASSLYYTVLIGYYDYIVTKLPKIGSYDCSQITFYYSRIIALWQFSACDYFRAVSRGSHNIQ